MLNKGLGLPGNKLGLGSLVQGIPVDCLVGYRGYSFLNLLQ